MLSGYKTYLCALGVAVIAVAVNLGWITTDTANLLFGLIGASGLAALRAAVK